MKKIFVIFYPICIILTLFLFICCMYYYNVITIQIRTNMDELLDKAYEAKGVYSESCKVDNVQISSEDFSRMNYIESNKYQNIEYNNVRTPTKVKLFFNQAYVSYKYSYLVTDDNVLLYQFVKIKLTLKDSKWIVESVYLKP